MKVIVDEQLVNYQAEGSGKTILLLHGWGTNLQTFDGLSKYFVSEYRVIRIDLPGFGASPRPAGDWDINDYAIFVSKFLAKINEKEIFAVFGHSFGGRVTIKAIARRYIHPQKVVLIGSAGIKPAASVRKTAYQSIAKIGKTVTNLPGLKSIQSKLRKRLYVSAGATDYLAANEMKPIFLSTIREDLQKDAAYISIPTLLVWGDDDVDTPVADGQKFHRIIKRSKLVVISDAGHFVYNDKPEEVATVIGEFLS